MTALHRGIPRPRPWKVPAQNNPCQPWSRDSAHPARAARAGGRGRDRFFGRLALAIPSPAPGPLPETRKPQPGLRRMTARERESNRPQFQAGAQSATAASAWRCAAPGEQPLPAPIRRRRRRAWLSAGRCPRLAAGKPWEAVCRNAGRTYRAGEWARRNADSRRDGMDRKGACS